ncbi:hypothetical protein KP509_32G064100 [Ceratopteris richardii]|uniref:Short-chain dehydrogenase TIC 32, chloroplastic n=1 Tax=Ceratopteris richardii TaxID=49495 RepID=A0A8T2QW68_CERRI|nr:hypothetical protein KP509_32G064100 [Ceratopteris richardii]
MGNLMLEYLTGAPGKSGFGSSSTAEDVTLGLSLGNLTAIVTGATSGIGAETAKVLAKRGCLVIVPARNLKAAESLKESILRESPKAKILTFKMDLSSFSSVRCFAEQFLALNLPLNILINNAGVACKSYRKSDDGYEMTFATNHLGHFLLTELLLERMVKSADEMGVQGRIVNVASCLHTWVGKDGIAFDKLHDKQSYVESMNYAQSKLANILHSNQLALRLKEMGASVTANSVHPGIVKTNITRDRGGFVTDMIFRIASIFLKTIPQGAATVCYVAAHPNVEGATGKYFLDCNEAECSYLANDKKQAARLWEYSERLTRTQAP